MNKDLKKFVVTANPDDRVIDVISAMAGGGKKFFGISLIIDNERALKGIFNNGDVLRLVAAGGDLTQPISSVMIREPITVKEGVSDRQVIKHVRNNMLKRTSGSKDLTKYIPVLDSEGIVIDILDMYDILARSPRQGDRIEIYGLGFVGLTLAAVLAARGHKVTGIDTDKSLVERLKRCEPHVHEPRLAEMMRQAMENGMLKFTDSPLHEHNRVYVVAVGTPVDESGVASISALNLVCQAIGPRLKNGDTVMLRSTVSVGTTRQQVIPVLEEYSGLIAGRGFHVAFCPERTVEGNAIQELTSLPQIVGGYTDSCTERAVSFWSTVTDTVVHVDNLEAAELVKLINNSFRDLSFAFANGLALLADRFNIDSSRLIVAANEGYPRNPIPRPSPGVGGYCLTKDPFIYASVSSGGGHNELSRIGRKINSNATFYPITILKRFAKRINRPVKDLQVFVVGMAFKGRPETNDLRGSTSLDVVAELQQLGCNFECFDAVIENEELKKRALNPTDLKTGLNRADAIMILNNHEDNISETFLASISSGRQVLVFDGWGMLDRNEVERYNDLIYSSLGYMTPEQGNNKDQ